MLQNPRQKGNGCSPGSDVARIFVVRGGVKFLFSSKTLAILNNFLVWAKLFRKRGVEIHPSLPLGH